MKKIATILIIFCILCSMFVFPHLTKNVQAIGQHEVASGATYGTIENATHTDSTEHTFVSDNDSFITGLWSDVNYGSETGVFVFYNPIFPPKYYRGLIKYNISSIPSDANITEAKVRLYTYTKGQASDPEVYFYRITGNWDESAVTWDTQPTTVFPTSTDSQTITSAYDWYEWNITDDAQSFVNGSNTNYGWMIRVPETGGDSLSVGFYSKEWTGTTYDPQLVIKYEIKFNSTRTIGGIEVNNCSFIPSTNYSDNVTLKIPVSTDVSGIFNVTNNTGSILANEVSSTDLLVNNTFWYDSATQMVYIRTINITTTMTVNWTVNCSYGVTFNLIIPTYLEVGQYFHSEGFIENSTGSAISGMIAETRLLYLNGTDALAVNPKHNCTDGNYRCTFATTTLSPGVYSVSIEFTDPASGIIFKKGATLYLSVDPGPGIYVTTFLYFTFYNSNTGTGLSSESFKIYVSDDTTIDSTDRKYVDSIKVYTGQTIYYRIDDYFDNQIYPTSGDYTTLNITSIEQEEDIPIVRFDIAIKNLNYTILRFSMNNGSRYYNATLFPMDSFHFFIIPGTYNITKRYYNPFNKTLTKTETDSITISADDFYIATGYTAIAHISWYNTNEALGLPDKTLKLYIDGARQTTMTYYTTINNTINITVLDYYNSTMYQGDITITSQYFYIDMGLTFHSWLFGNKNDIDYMLSILKDGGSRWYERGIVPYSEREFILPSGDYTLRIYYNDSGDYTEIYNNSNHTIVASSVYVIHGTNLSEIITGQSIIIGNLLELRDEVGSLVPSGASYSSPIIIPPETPEYPEAPFSPSEMYSLLRVTNMPISNEEVTVVFIDSGFTPRTYSGINLSTIIPYAHPVYSSAYDANGHGTWISYALASIFQTYLPNVRLISYKVFNENGACTFSQLIEALDAVKALKPDVVSFSGGVWGSPTDNISKKVEELKGEGITVVVSAGNLGPAAGTILSPASSRDAICVGALDPMLTILDREDDEVTPWSSRGPIPFIDYKPDFTAPGESIRGPWLSGEKIVSGTSMATPLVAAGIAILYGNNKGILNIVDMLYFWDGHVVPNILEDAMKDTAFKKSPVDSYGWGIPDFEKANDVIIIKVIISILLFIVLLAVIIVALFFILHYLKGRKHQKIT